MQLTFLGTSSAIPTKTRNMTALAFGSAEAKLWNLVDCGEGTQYRVLHSPLSLPRLKLILITHLHGDHIFGLPGLLATRAAQCSGPEQEQMRIIGPRGLKKYLETTFQLGNPGQNFPYENYSVDELPTTGGRFELEEFAVEAVPLSHNVTSFAYVIDEHSKPGRFNLEKAQEMGVPSGPLYGKLKAGESVELPDGRKLKGTDFTDATVEGRRIIIGGDNDKPELLAEYLKTSLLFVHEASHTRETMAAVGGKLKHSTAAAVAKTAQKAGLKNLILTHFSARFAESHTNAPLTLDAIEQEARSEYSGNLHLAQDFDRYTLDRTGKLTKSRAN